ncbi:MAG: peptidyl-prolyl cis-trans isomerase [Caulobacteraceae bacterium]
MLAFGAALAALGACERTAAPGRAAPWRDVVVARLNGDTVWSSDVRREAAAQGLIGRDEILEPASPIFGQVMTEVIDQKLLAAEAHRRGLDSPPAARRRLAAARERTLADLLLESQVAKAVNRQAVDGLYQEMLRGRTPVDDVGLRQIVVADRRSADEVKRQLDHGAAFEALVSRRSTDAASRLAGGALPPATTDTLPAPYAAAIRGAKAGQIVGPFRTDAGYVVARIDSIAPEPPPTLAAARPRIIRFLTFDQVKDLVLDLRRSAKIETLIKPPASPPALAPIAGPRP